MPLRKTLGQKIRAAREASGFRNQDELAAVIGVAGRRAVIRWEKDEAVPQGENRERLLKALPSLKESDFPTRPEAPPALVARVDALESRLVSMEGVIARLEALLSEADEAPGP